MKLPLTIFQTLLVVLLSVAGKTCPECKKVKEGPLAGFYALIDANSTKCREGCEYIGADSQHNCLEEALEDLEGGNYAVTDVCSGCDCKYVEVEDSYGVPIRKGCVVTKAAPKDSACRCLLNEEKKKCHGVRVKCLFKWMR